MAKAATPPDPQWGAKEMGAERRDVRSNSVYRFCFGWTLGLRGAYGGLKDRAVPPTAASAASGLALVQLHTTLALHATLP